LGWLYNFPLISLNIYNIETYLKYNLQILGLVGKLISLIVRGEYKLRMAEVRVVRRMFRPMMGDKRRWRYIYA
jgi:hypothetical protein